MLSYPNHLSFTKDHVCAAVHRNMCVLQQLHKDQNTMTYSSGEEGIEQEEAADADDEDPGLPSAAIQSGEEVNGPG
jgi:hypothetical protein